jgi:hypothetical protein
MTRSLKALESTVPLRARDDAGGNDLTVVSVTVDLEGIAGFLQSLRHGLNGLRLECANVV